MRVFVIGGENAAPRGAGEADVPPLLRAVGGRIGAALARGRHSLVTCSPFQGSLDREAQVGFRDEWAGAPPTGSMEVHHPDDEAVSAAVTGVIAELGLDGVVGRFGHPAIFGPERRLDLTQSWLLSQLAALDRCQGVISLGGKSDGSSNLLLHLADARRIPVLPFTFFGGAAEASYRRRRYELGDRLGEEVLALTGSEGVDQAAALLERLVEGKSGKASREGRTRFFISYPRARPAEADFVEMTLRRRNQDVFRDDHGLEAGDHLQSTIREQLFAADVFIALWGREYACSPWCHDELEQALDRMEGGRLRIVLLCVDETRIVPPRARGILHHLCMTRADIEARVLDLLAREPPGGSQE